MKQILDGFTLILTIAFWFSVLIGIVWVLEKIAVYIVALIGWTPILIVFGVIAFIALCYDLGSDHFEM